MFVPLDFIVVPKAGRKWWRMLMQLLSVGRLISLPANAVGGAKAGIFAHRRLCADPQAIQYIHRQLRRRAGGRRRMAGFTYIADAGHGVGDRYRREAAVPSAILKYHCTKLRRG